jgi:hypothetical protein
MGKSRVFAALAAAAVALSACQPDPNSPEGIVRGLYAPYVNAAPGGPVVQIERVYTPDLAKAVADATALSNVLDEPLFDFNPLTSTQDGDISELNVAAAGPATPGKTLVAARFRLNGQSTQVVYTMLRDGKTWKIDNIGYGYTDMRTIVADAVKPAGPPEAMIAPIKVIYNHYAQSSLRNPVQPLSSFETVTPDFAALLRKAAERARTEEGPALDFDPIVDSQDFQLQDLTYQPVSTAVIVRFTNMGVGKTLVYEMVEQSGAWKIDNIRRPGRDGWSVREKLAAFGITP